MSLDLSEIRRQQRRVTTLLHGNPTDLPLISYRQGKSSSYGNEALGGRYPAGSWTSHMRACRVNPSAEEDRLSDLFDESNDLPNRKPTNNKNRNLKKANRDDTVSSSTPLPSIKPHTNKSRRRPSKGGAKTQNSARHSIDGEQRGTQRRQKSPENRSTRRNSQEINPPTEKSLKPGTSRAIVKYQHQKFEPSTEERWKKYRDVRLDLIRKGGAEAQGGRRCDSSLSSISNISALQRQFQEDISPDDQAKRKSDLMYPGAKWDDCSYGANVITQLQLNRKTGGLMNEDGTEGLPHPSDLLDFEKEDDFNDNLFDKSRFAHSSPILHDGQENFSNNPNRLPDINIYSQPSEPLSPERKRWRPGIGETTRAFVFSYFNHLPPLKRSLDADDEELVKENEFPVRGYILRRSQ